MSDFDSVLDPIEGVTVDYNLLLERAGFECENSVDSHCEKSRGLVAEARHVQSGGLATVSLEPVTGVQKVTDAPMVEVGIEYPRPLLEAVLRARLDGLLVAMLERVNIVRSTPEVRSHLAHDPAPHVASIVFGLSRVNRNADLTLSYEVSAWLGGRCLVTTYMSPPFGVWDLDRLALQAVTYAELPRPHKTCVSPGCADDVGGAALDRPMRLLCLATRMCSKCAERTARASYEPTPRRPKGWD